MKILAKNTLVLGLAVGFISMSSIAANAESSFAYAGGKQTYDKKIEKAAAEQAAKKMGSLRGTFSNIDENAFVESGQS